ncbi:TPA: phage holin [Streptococcus suis]|nr:phage holin [Streptococcus suis]
MTNISEIIISAALGILTILGATLISAIKSYIVAKGGEKAIKIVEILAKGGEKAIKIVEILAHNAVNAVEQVSTETGFKGKDKLAEAKKAILNELTKYNIHMTDEDLTVFVESAVKQMNNAWKE